jgi:hypothetical protein
MIQHVNIFLIVIYYITSAAVQYPILHYLFYRQLAKHAASACPGLENEEEETDRKAGRQRMAKDAKNHEEDGAAGENSGSADKQKTRHENACPNCDKIFISTDQRNMHVYKA